jgi:SAM-dependent methyltransferase
VPIRLDFLRLSPIIEREYGSGDEERSSFFMQKVNCPLCGSLEYKVIFRAPADPVEKLGYFSVVRCPECDFVFTNPQAEEKDLKKLYPTEYYGEEHQRFWTIVEKFIEFFRKRRIDKIEKFKKKGVILDIGCGRGKMLAGLRDKGWETYGTELSEDSSKFARERLGLKVYPGDFLSSKFPEVFFDCVTLWHVLEHLKDPLKVLMEIKRILKKDGLLLVAVPDYGGAQSVFSGRAWFHLDVPRHYSHFTFKTLKSFLDKAGFKVRQSRHFSLEYDPIGVLQSFYNLMGFKHNLLYGFLRAKKDRLKILSEHRWQSLFIFWTFPGFLGLSLFLSLYFSAWGRGGSLVLYALKGKR